MTTDTTIDQAAVDAFVAGVPADATREQFAAVIARMRAIRPDGPRPKGPTGYVNYATVQAAADRLQALVDAR
jgi:hypothetical protein